MQTIDSVAALTIRPPFPVRAYPGVFSNITLRALADPADATSDEGLAHRGGETTATWEIHAVRNSHKYFAQYLLPVILLVYLVRGCLYARHVHD